MEVAVPLTSRCLPTAEDMCESARDSFSFVVMKSKFLIYRAALPAEMLILVRVHDLPTRIVHGGPIPDADGIRTDGCSLFLLVQLRLWLPQYEAVVIK